MRSDKTWIAGRAAGPAILCSEVRRVVPLGSRFRERVRDSLRACGERIEQGALT